MPSFSGPFETEGRLERPRGEYGVRAPKEAMVPMRDGIRLATDLYLPLGKSPTEAVLIRTPYGKMAFSPETSQTGTVTTFVEHGYAVLVQDTRGRFGSEGQFAPTYRDDTDSYDTMDWIAEQPWSNGIIGTHGCSYLGENQVTAARLQHPAWKAAIPMASGGANGGVRDRNRQFALWNGGAFELAMGLSWFNQYGGTNGVDAAVSDASDVSDGIEGALFTLPVVDGLAALTTRDTQYDEYVTHRPGTTYWDRYPYFTGGEEISVPSLFIESWYDYGPQETFVQVAHFQQQSGDLADTHRVVIDPGTHCSQHQLTDQTVVGARPVGDARFEFFELYLAWFDHWLRGIDNGVDMIPFLTYYRMGDNQWTSANSWPVEGTEATPYFLVKRTAGFGDLALQAPQELASQTYTYDPGDPLPTLGAPVCCTVSESGQSLEGAFDQIQNSTRADVLIFETPVLTKTIDVTGPVTATLYVQSNARDTDFTAKLIDVYPDGRSFNVVDGIQRMRWRHGYDKERLLETDQVYEVEIDMQATSNVFREGHRIRVEISSSNFPRFTRNLNTGDDNHLSLEYQEAENTVFLGGKYASFVTLPVVDHADRSMTP